MLPQVRHQQREQRDAEQHRRERQNVQEIHRRPGTSLLARSGRKDTSLERGRFSASIDPPGRLVPRISPALPADRQQSTATAVPLAGRPQDSAVPQRSANAIASTGLRDTAPWPPRSG